MSEPAPIRAARAEVEARKAEMIDTVRELQQRLQPATLASGAWEAAKNKGANLAEDAVDAVRSRPVAVGGVAAALGLFLARAPIKDVARRFYDGMTSAKDEPPQAAEPKPATTVSSPRAPTTRPPAKPTKPVRSRAKPTQPARPRAKPTTTEKPA